MLLNKSLKIKMGLPCRDADSKCFLLDGAVDTNSLDSSLTSAELTKLIAGTISEGQHDGIS